MGAAVVRKESEANTAQWLQSIRYAAKSNQSMDLHFRTLNDGQKKIICQSVAGLRIRLFVVISNKKNMRRYKNQKAGNISKHRHWFYWWMARLMLERITDFCAAQNVRDNTPGKKLQVEFSRRKDMKENEFTDYFTRIWAQGDGVFLKRRQINWSVFDFRSVQFFDHAARAGLQFADVVASSFFQAVNIHPHGSCYADYAKLLEPRIHRPLGGVPLDEGFVVQPNSLIEAVLREDQKEIFRYYGYPEERLTKAAARGHSSMGR